MEELEVKENTENKIARSTGEMFESMNAKEYSKSGIYTFAKMTFEERTEWSVYIAVIGDVSYL